MAIYGLWDAMGTLVDLRRVESILQLRRKGSSKSAIVKITGIGRTTLTEWLRRGRDGKEPYATFKKAYDQAYKEWVEEETEKLGRLLKRGGKYERDTLS